MDFLFSLAAMILCMWFLHLVAGVVLSGPIILAGWNRAQFQGWEAMAFVFPYAVWMTCMLVNDTGKSLSNLFEPIFYISPAIAVAALLRVIVGHSRWTKTFACGLFVSLCISAFCVYWFTPGWPE